MYSTAELCLLARSYLAGTGLAAATLSRYTVGNTKLFPRLLAGMDCTARSAEQASIWLDLNWPAEIPWPPGMRPRGTALAAVQPEILEERPKRPSSRCDRGVSRARPVPEGAATAAGESPDRR
jgi:hypothetical protein